MKNENNLTIECIVVLAKLTDGKIYQVSLNEEEAKTVKTTIGLLHQWTVKIVEGEIESVSF